MFKIVITDSSERKTVLSFSSVYLLSCWTPDYMFSSLPKPFAQMMPIPSFNVFLQNIRQATGMIKYDTLAG